MPINVCCEGCGKAYRVKDESAGKRMKCKECGAAILIPAPDADDFDDEEVDEEFDCEEPPHRTSGQSSRKSKPSRSSRRDALGTMEDIFTSDRSVWMKMAGGAAATPLLLVVVLNKQRRRGGPAIDFTSPTTLAMLAGSVVVGAILGALLTAKDVVQRRLEEGQQVSLPWTLLFGKGLISLLCVWFPLVILVTFVVTMLTLGI